MEQRWLRWYGDNHIEQIALGAITLRRRSNAQNWFCSATINSTLENPAGKQFVRLFNSQDYLANIDDTHALLNEIFSPTVLDFAGDENQPIAHANHGFHLEAKIHPLTKTVLKNLNGKINLEDAIQLACVELNMAHEILLEIKELLKLGMIVPQRIISPTVQPLADNIPASRD